MLCGSNDSLEAIIKLSSYAVLGLHQEKGKEEMLTPFASITWSRFKGSSADQSGTLSQLARTEAGQVGSPMDATMRRGGWGVKDMGRGSDLAT